MRQSVPSDGEVTQTASGPTAIEPTDDAGTPEYILTWTRIGANVPPADAWRAFAQRLQSFRSSGHLPPP